MSRKKLLIIAGAVVVVAIAATSFLKSGEESSAIAVETARVERHALVQTVSTTGRIQPKTQVKISADVSAKIMRLGVKDGDWVEKGDFLVELDGERHRAAVESAEANLRSFQANAKLARENMIKAEKDYQRTSELFAQKLESQATLDAMRAAYEVEKARHASNLDQVEQAKASLKQANDDLSKTRIFAPMSGTVSQLNKEVGEIALGSQFQEDVIMVVSNLSGMEALVDVDENDIVSVSQGDRATIEVDALPNVVFTGIVSEIANSAKISGEGSTDQKTDFEVKIAIENIEGSTAQKQSSGNAEVKFAGNTAQSELRPGMTASGEIVTETRDKAIAVPIQAVAVRTPDQLLNPAAAPQPAAEGEEAKPRFTPDKDGFVSVVFVVNGGKVEARQVSTGIQSETHIEILDGIAEGEEVVVGNYRAISKDLFDGAEVTTGAGSNEEALAQKG